MEGQKYVSEYLTRPALFFCIVCGSHSLTLRGKNCDALSSYQLHRGSLAWFGYLSFPSVAVWLLNCLTSTSSVVSLACDLFRVMTVSVCSCAEGFTPDWELGA